MVIHMVRHKLLSDLWTFTSINLYHVAHPYAAHPYAAHPIAPLAPVAHGYPYHHYGAPAVAKVAAPAGLLGVAYSPAVAVSHMSYQAPAISYAW